MMRPARLLFVLGLLGFLSPRSPEAALDQTHVEKEIEAIIAAPEYDWLRQEESSNPSLDQGQTTRSSRGRESRIVQTDPQGSGCGYRMGPPVERKPAEHKSCDNDTPGSCDNNSVGDCQFRPSTGACGSFSIGASGNGIGYVLGFLLLAGILAFVIWSVIRAEKTRVKTASKTPMENIDPGRVQIKDAPLLPIDLLLSRAREAADHGDYKTAIGIAYLACISILHRAGQVNLGRSTTNFEIITTVKRNGGPHQPAQALINVFEEVFFGEREPTVTHWNACQSLLEGHFVQL